MQNSRSRILTLLNLTQPPFPMDGHIYIYTNYKISHIKYIIILQFMYIKYNSYCKIHDPHSNYTTIIIV